MMRLLQALGLILTSYTGLIALLLPLRSGAAHLAARLTLVSLQDWLNVTRRSVRTFWFLRSFQASYARYVSPRPKGAEDWLDIWAGSMLGVFGMLETATLPDMLRISGLEVFGLPRTRELNVQAQVFWFLGLLAMVLSAGLQASRLLAERAVPAGADFGAEVEDEKSEKNEKGDGKKDTAKARAAEKKRKEEKKVADKQIRAQISALGLKIINDSLDMVIPANICGWTEFHPGQVGIAMALTSLITLRGHWTRCGQALQ